MNKFKISICVLVSLSSSLLMAAGKGTGSVKDLIFPAINFVILFGFIIFKYKNVIAKNYSDESLRIENLLNDASEADKQATLKLDSLQKQYNNIDDLKKGLREKANERLTIQLETINSESKEKLKKLKDDKQLHFDQEKNILVTKTNSKVLDMVINDAKEIVGKDLDRKRTTEEKLISAIN